MNHIVFRIAIGSWLLAAPLVASALQPTPPKLELPGQRADGSVLLPNLWSLRPAGQQVEVGNFPVNIAVHPDGRFAAVLHSGYGPHEIIIVDVPAAKVISRTRVHEAFYGLEFSNGGNRLYCSGSSDEVVRVFDFQNGNLIKNEDIRLRDIKQRGIPCGLAVSSDATKLYVANVWGHRVSKVDLLTRTNLADIPLALGGTNDDSPRFQTKGPIDPYLAAITKRAEAQLDPGNPEAPFPYGCRLDEKKKRLYVSLWAEASVAAIDLKTDRVSARWETEEHPNEMLLTKSGRYLYVANANRNTVTVIDTVQGKTIETLYASLTATALPGSTPSSLAMSPDGNMLFVANANNNNVAVFDVSVAGRSRSLGFIPVGWYPTSVRVTPDGKHLLVANGRGITSKANPNGPVPGKKGPPSDEYIGVLFPGSLSIIDLPRRAEFLKQLAGYTAQAYLCTPQKSVTQVSPPAGCPVPAEPGKTSPIKYCLYIIKENRTYDQVLGDLPRGNGDPKLCLFPEKVTPNHHQLAREFVLLDNFYVDAEVSADGHEWTMGAYATDFVVKNWPLAYGHNRSNKFPYPAEGQFPIAAPATLYLWDRAAEAGLSYRSYGEFVSGGKTPKDPGHTKIAALRGHFDPFFRGFDTGYPDVKRAQRYIDELKRFEREGEMPQFQVLRLPNDHTAGAVPKNPTPTAFVADNDCGFGMIIEAVSHSKFWPQTAIFVVEDDAQDGPDHVDAHRTIAYVISPYTRSGKVDSTMYSTTSMVHTMELILGLKPMTQFDTAATPMFNSFQSQPDLRPYDALPPGVDLNEKNSQASWGSKLSEKMDFSKEDAADEQQLNEIIWRSVRGADHPMPAPTRAGFVYARPKGDGDGD